MQTTNAIKKLEKAGFEVSKSNNFVFAKRNGSLIQFIDQDGIALALGDGNMRFDSLKQAITFSK